MDATDNAAVYLATLAKTSMVFSVWFPRMTLKSVCDRVGPTSFARIFRFGVNSSCSSDSNSSTIH